MGKKGLIKERLDKFLVNVKMMEAFKDIKVAHQYYYNSNHRVVLASLNRDGVKHK